MEVQGRNDRALLVEAVPVPMPIEGRNDRDLPVWPVPVPIEGGNDRDLPVWLVPVPIEGNDFEGMGVLRLNIIAQRPEETFSHIVSFWVSFFGVEGPNGETREGPPLLGAVEVQKPLGPHAPLLGFCAPEKADAEPRIPFFLR